MTTPSSPRDVPAAPVGDLGHIVAEGDCCVSIAARGGLPVEELWNHPQNAALRQAREDPSVLLRGDRVFVPEPRQKFVDRQINQRHEFVRDVGTRLQLKFTREREPCSNATCVFVLDGATTTRKTDKDGRVEFNVSAQATSAFVRLFDGMHEFCTELQIGSLEAHTSILGAAQRLKNLGYTSQDPVGTMEPWLIAAMKRFQSDSGLPSSDTLDKTTSERLRAAHGS